MERRALLKLGIGSAGALWGLSSLAAPAAVCGLTPKQTEGPFYPVKDQEDKDADLVSVAGRTQLALGQIVVVQGLVTNQNCEPVSGALVEIWQACASGKYDHPSDPNPAPLDANFQYWGKAVTDANGNYRFRTIIPGAYAADQDWTRPPHIHFKVTKKAYFELTTQMYFAGEKLNDKDLILQSLAAAEQGKVIVPFEKTDDSEYPVGQFNLTIKKVARK